VVMMLLSLAVPLLGSVGKAFAFCRDSQFCRKGTCLFFFLSRYRDTRVIGVFLQGENALF
jgi:hypothetical protein